MKCFNQYINENVNSTFTVLEYTYRPEYYSIKGILSLENDKGSCSVSYINDRKKLVEWNSTNTDEPYMVMFYGNIELVLDDQITIDDTIKDVDAKVEKLFKNGVKVALDCRYTKDTNYVDNYLKKELMHSLGFKLKKELI